MRFAVLVLSFSGALSQCTSYYTNFMSACDVANSTNTDMTRFCNGACNTALNTASNGCSASVPSEAQIKTSSDTYLSYCSPCMQAYMTYATACHLGENSTNHDMSRYCSGDCNAKLTAMSTTCTSTDQ